MYSTAARRRARLEVLLCLLHSLRRSAPAPSEREPVPAFPAARQGVFFLLIHSFRCLRRPSSSRTSWEAYPRFASGGPVSLTRKKPGKERGGAPPLRPGAVGAEAKGALTRRRTSGCGT